MTTVKRPARLFSFTDFAKSSPRDPPPGDRLDAQFIELIEAIRTTQAALAEIRQPSGQLKPQSVGPEHLRVNLADEIIERVSNAVEPVRAVIRAATSDAQEHERNAQMFAKDAEAAVDVARHMVSGLDALNHIVKQRTKVNTAAADEADLHATESENWANYSKAQSDNAIAAKDEALQWAEFLAGPVVNALEAPAYIADSPFPHGLYYQPVQGGVAGLWSAKWWALWAQQLVGKTSFYYLGPWDHAPLPGEQNPATGEVVPNPLAPGSLYYDTVTQTLYAWTGTGWAQPLALGQGFQARFVYLASAGQTVFSGADHNGATPTVGSYPSDVFVNGVRLVDTIDYVIDQGASTLTINTPLTVNSVVQWDLLVSSDSLAPGSVNAFKMHAMTPDGVTKDFTLQYTASGGGTVNAAVGDGAQLLVSLDGTIQEVGVDFTASGSALHFLTAPDATAHIWAIWYQPGAVP